MRATGMCLLSIMLASACASIRIHRVQFTVPPIPTVEGPITGPGPMYPGLILPLTPGTDPADFGYVTEEYFVSGTASGQPYKTRILVRRPERAERFSGIVVSEVMHFSGSAVTFQPALKSVLLRGHVHVEIAAQPVNVSATLKPFNSERYASLSSRSSDAGPWPRWRPTGSR